MDQERESIIERVEKLLRKAESTTHEAERDAFMAKATELMQRHRIEQAELRLAGGTSEEITHEVWQYSDNNANMPGKRHLLHVACFIAGDVQFIYHTGSINEQRCTMIGTTTEIETAKVIYASLYTQASVKCLELRLKSKRERTSFLVGYAQGVLVKAEAAREQVETGPGMALVLASRKEEVNDYLDENFNTKTGPSYNADRAAQILGNLEGQKADIGQEQLT